MNTERLHKRLHELERIAEHYGLRVISKEVLKHSTANRYEIAQMRDHLRVAHNALVDISLSTRKWTRISRWQARRNVRKAIADIDRYLDESR